MAALAIASFPLRRSISLSSFIINGRLIEFFGRLFGVNEQIDKLMGKFPLLDVQVETKTYLLTHKTVNSLQLKNHLKENRLVFFYIR